MNGYFDVEIKSAGDSGFLAIASTSRIDRDGEILDPGCFAPVPDYVPVHLYHDRTKVAGSGTPFYDGDVLKIRGTFADTAYGREARELTTKKHIRTMSVGFGAAVYETDPHDRLRHLRRGELMEVSFVSIPANADAQILVARAYSGDATASAEHALARAKGTLARLDAEQMLSKTSPDAALASAKQLLRDTAHVRAETVDIVNDKPDGNVVRNWPDGEAPPVLPRRQLISLGVQAGFREVYVRGKGLRRTPVEYELFVEKRNAGWSPMNRWHRYKDNPGVLEHQGPGTANQTILEETSMTRTEARALSQRNNAHFDPDATSTVKVAPAVDW